MLDTPFRIQVKKKLQHSFFTSSYLLCHIAINLLIHLFIKLHINNTHICGTIIKHKALHTTRSHTVFSRKAPMQPAKPIIKISAPAIKKKKAGSTGKFVSLLMLLKVFFSARAHSPIPHIVPPNN